MSLENWRSLNYFVQDLIVLQMFFVTGFVVFKKNSVSKKYHPIIYYLVFSVIIEVVSKFFLKFNPDSAYFTYNNFVFIIFELVYLYWFIYNAFPKNKIIGFGIILNFSIILCFLTYLLLTNNPNSGYRSLIPSVLHVFLLLYVIFLRIKFKTSNSLFKGSDFIIMVSFLMSYLMLIIVFFFLPYLIEYSRILANQFIFFKYLISISFYFLIAYAISLQNNIR